MSIHDYKNNVGYNIAHKLHIKYKNRKNRFKYYIQHTYINRNIRLCGPYTYESDPYKLKNRLNTTTKLKVIITK